MLLNKEQIHSIQNKKTTYVKNFVSLEREYDFNLISNLLEENTDKIFTRALTDREHLKHIYVLKNVINTLKEFKFFFDFLSKLFKFKPNPKDDIDIYFSLISQVGSPHKDIENVFIIGLKGKTVYRVFEEDTNNYEINKGDMIFIPSNVKHKAIGITPRIIASIGFYGEMNG